jgi:hypothetical protein
VKRCIRCQIDKPTSEFNKRARSADGRHSVCKACRAVERKAYLQSEQGKKRHREANLRYYRRYFAKDGHVKGEEHGRHILTEADIPRLIEMRNAGHTWQHLEEIFGVDNRALRAAYKGDTWKHVKR